MKLQNFLKDCVKWIKEIQDKDEFQIETVRNSDYFLPLYQRMEKEKPDSKDELKKCVLNNSWIEYFERRKLEMGATWIDFESEISYVLGVFEKGRLDYLEDALFLTDQISPSKNCKAFLDNFYLDKNICSLEEKAFTYYRDNMLNALDKLISYMLENNIKLEQECIDCD